MLKLLVMPGEKEAVLDEGIFMITTPEPPAIPAPPPPFASPPLPTFAGLGVPALGFVAPMPPAE